MDYPNQISATISDKSIKEINDAIISINKKLPDLATLSEEELTALPKTGTNTINFVIENLKDAENHPEIVPKNVNVDEIKKDVELITAIFKILEPLKKLEKRLEDGALLAGSEAYLPSIAIYNAIKADAIRRKYKRDNVNT